MQETDFDTRTQGTEKEAHEDDLQGFSGMTGKRKLSFGQTLWLALLLLVLGLTLYWVFLNKKKGSDDQPAPDQNMAASPVANGSAEGGEPEAKTVPSIIPLTIPLSGSDPEVRRQSRAISNHGRFSELLKESDLIRRFVAVTDNIARGESPRSWLESAAPKGKPKTVKRGGKIYLDPDSYRRYDELTALILSLDDQYCADLYLLFEPQIQEAYRDLGNAQHDFIEALQAAVDQLLETPVVQTPLELQEKMLSFAYAGDKWEDLNPARKHFLRLGPDNLQKLQKKIGTLLQVLKARKKNP